MKNDYMHAQTEETESALGKKKDFLFKKTQHRRPISKIRGETAVIKHLRGEIKKVQGLLVVEIPC